MLGVGQQRWSFSSPDPQGFFPLKDLLGHHFYLSVLLYRVGWIKPSPGLGLSCSPIQKFLLHLNVCSFSLNAPSLYKLARNNPPFL